MYDRSACASCAVSSSLILTRSPIDTSPSSLPSSTTGKWRKRRAVISPSASSTGIDSRPTTRLQVIRASTGSRSKSRSPSAYSRTMSRSVKMPTGQPSASGTSTAPTFSACMVRIASATLDLADTVTRRRPLAANTSSSFIGASRVVAASLAQDLADVVAGVEVRDELPQIGSERVASRHHADRPRVLDHRNVPEAAFVHEVKRVPEGPLGVDGARVRRHHLGDSRRLGVASFRNDAEQCIAFGEDSREAVMVDDQNRTDTVALHELRCR